MMSDPVFAIDSITLTATSSPEGTWRTNERLARERSEALKAVLSHEFRKMKDSLEIAGSYIADADGSIRRLEQKNPLPDLHVLLKTKWKAEDWDRLRALVVADTCMVDKEEVLALFTAERDPDRREAQIRRRFPRAYAYMAASALSPIASREFPVLAAPTGDAAGYGVDDGTRQRLHGGCGSASQTPLRRCVEVVASL